MPNSKQFLIDANVFIHAYQQYYAFDIAPVFWSNILEKAEANQVISINPVKEELNNFGEDDDLAKWAAEEFNSNFKSINDPAVLNTYGELMIWADSHQQYNSRAKAEFSERSVADAWLIAYAKAKNCILVTHEKYQPDVKRRIPIPNVCKDHGVQYIDLFEMLRRLSIQLS